MLNGIGEHSEKYVPPGRLRFLVKDRAEFQSCGLHVPEGMPYGLELLVGMAYFFGREEFFWHGRFEDVFPIEFSGFGVGFRTVPYAHCLFGNGYRIYLLHVIFLLEFSYFVVPILEFLARERQLELELALFIPGGKQFLPVVGAPLFLSVIRPLDSEEFRFEFRFEFASRNPFLFREFRVYAKDVSLVSVGDFREILVEKGHLHDSAFFQRFYFAGGESGNIFDALGSRSLGSRSLGSHGIPVVSPALHMFEIVPDTHPPVADQNQTFDVEFPSEGSDLFRNRCAVYGISLEYLYFEGKPFLVRDEPYGDNFLPRFFVPVVSEHGKLVFRSFEVEARDIVEVDSGGLPFTGCRFFARYFADILPNVVTVRFVPFFFEGSLEVVDIGQGLVTVLFGERCGIDPEFPGNRPVALDPVDDTEFASAGNELSEDHEEGERGILRILLFEKGGDFKAFHDFQEDDDVSVVDGRFDGYRPEGDRIVFFPEGRGNGREGPRGEIREVRDDSFFGLPVLLVAFRKEGVHVGFPILDSGVLKEIHGSLLIIYTISIFNKSKSQYKYIKSRDYFLEGKVRF